MQRRKLGSVRARWGLTAMSLAFLAGSLFACNGSSKKPGFMELGGAGGAGSATTGATSSTHATAVATTGVSTATTATTVAATSSSTGSTCADIGLGADTEATAYNLGDITDCDNTGSQLSGVAPDGFDVDWYRYHGADTISCVVDPTVTLQSSYPLRVCQYAQCDNNIATHVSCPGGTDPATSPAGRPGCCGTQGFTLGLSCGSSSLGSYSSTVFISVDDPQASPCVSYTLGYHF